MNDHFPPDHWGGSNSVAFLQAKGLRARGVDARVFATTQERGKETGWREYQGIPVRIFYTDYHPRWWAWLSLYNPEVLGEFERELRLLAPDVVHFHNVHHFFSYHTIAIARRAGAKTFLTVHDVMSFAYQKLHNFIDYSSKDIPKSFNYYVPWLVNARDARKRYNPLRNLIIRFYLSRLDRVFAVSAALKQALAHNGIAQRVEVVSNGVDVAAFDQPFDTLALRKELGVDDSPIVLFVGRFTPDKGRDVLLRAFELVHKRLPEAKLLVVGFNADRLHEPVMWGIIEGLGIERNLVFVPAVEYIHMHKYYRIADVVAVPSVIFDSFPTANLEAMAAGRPVVATCFGGSREAVRDGETGYIVNPLDIETLASRIIGLLSDSEKAKAMGRAGRERLEKEFSITHQLAAYEARY
ncbi:glycosyltransferase family 4 protein [Candidatus Parcubacteria bacterium]|nr:glycosyltransferase family 4 protein [Candidatus Parcubacteria bacterium]